MSVRKALLSLALVGAAIPAAFAGTQSTWVGGEAGFETRTVPSSTTRAAVQAEFLAFRRNPVTANGGMQVGGEVGYVFPQHTYAVQGGKLVHTDQIAHNSPKPSLVKTPAERARYQEQYIN